MIRFLHIIIYILLANVCLWAQRVAPVSGSGLTSSSSSAEYLRPSQNQLGDTIISIVNFYPGSEIYELEGHSVLRVRSLGCDMAYSYGTFDFNAPNFVYRYVKGETDYWISAIPWNIFVYGYIDQGRRIVEHVLDMTPEQKHRLLDLLAQNLQPANRTYRYNYVRDNCATRPLHIVEQALNDSIVLAAPTEGSQGDEETFRSIMQHYHANYPWYQFGIDLALGPGIDKVLNTREKAFAPVVLDSQLDEATVSGNPLILKTNIINDTLDNNAVLDPTPWYLTPLAVCWTFFALTLLVCILDIVRRRPSRWFYSLTSTIYGLAGVLVWFLVLISEHEATSPNYLMVWLNPLWLLAAVLIWTAGTRRAASWIFAAEALATLVLMLIWPLLDQCTNAAFWPLMLAAVISGAVCASLLYRRPSAINNNNKKPTARK